jgi:hypothetical protein
VPVELIRAMVDVYVLGPVWSSEKKSTESMVIPTPLTLSARGALDLTSLRMAVSRERYVVAYEPSMTVPFEAASGEVIE